MHPKVAVRDRLIDAASELFYALGLRAVSADKIIERVGTTKATFYRHFPTKEHLVVAYLERRAAAERTQVDKAIATSGGDIDTALALIAEEIDSMARAPDFRGCPFINAAAEYPDAASPVRRVVDAHRDWYRRTHRELIAPLHLVDESSVAESLLLLRDGAMVAADLDGAPTAADTLLRRCRALLHPARG